MGSDRCIFTAGHGSQKRYCKIHANKAKRYAALGTKMLDAAKKP
jgi:hypothetical protein